jgi:DNA-binding MarR family transcriptional regulator
MLNADPFVSALRNWIDVFMRHSMRNFIHFARESGLSMSQFGTLFHLHREGSTGVTDLGQHLGLSSAAASQLLERLVQQELILRSEDPTDRRVKQIVLTEKGRRVLKEGIRARQGWLVDLVEILSVNEKEQITTALNIMSDRANQLEQPIEPEC